MSHLELSATIPNHSAGQRLDQALAALFPDYSRSRLQEWLKAGCILVDGKAWRGKDKVLGGEQVLLVADLAPEVSFEAEHIPLDIVYEDESILVINKPVGLVVHPGAGNLQGTLLNALLGHCPNLAEVPRAGIVHRLDKDTSGLLVVAKTLPAQTSLVSQLQGRTVSREYEAICMGTMVAGGTIDEPIGRHPVHRKKMAVMPEGLGKQAISHVRVLERFRQHTRVSVKLETGRTHQIRVHLAHRRFPLVGDRVYSNRLVIPKGSSTELIDTLRGFKRQALHARRLSLVHPLSNKTVSFEVKPPRDYLHLLELLRADMNAAKSAWIAEWEEEEMGYLDEDEPFDEDLD